MKYRKQTTGELIWMLLLFLFFLFNLIWEIILWHKGEITTYENVLFEMIVFGFLITWTKMDKQ